MDEKNGRAVIKAFKPLHQWNLEAHEQWLAQQARTGLVYEGGSHFRHRFMRGEPAEMSFCWDLAPHKTLDQLTYLQSCREAGWELAARVGLLFCWRRPAPAGEPAPPLRDKTAARAMYSKLASRCAGSAVAFVVPFILLARHLADESSRMPKALAGAVLVCSAALYVIQIHAAWKLKKRLRELGPN